MDEAVNLIQALGKGTLLSKLDLKDAYRVVPVNPHDRPPWHALERSAVPGRHASIRSPLGSQNFLSSCGWALVDDPQPGIHLFSPLPGRLLISRSPELTSL